MIFRKSYPAFLILFFSALLYGSLAHRHDIGWSNDDAIYILTAQTLWSGHYVDPTRPNQPPEIHFLPGFPALLAPFVIFIHSDWNKVKVVSWLLAVLSGFLAWRLYRRWLPEKQAYLALAFFAFNPLVISLSDVLLSEWLLLCLTLGIVLLVAHLEKYPSKRNQIALTTLLSWAALVRPEGVLLSLGIGAALLYRRMAWGAYQLTLAIPLAVFTGWLLRNFFISGQISTYAHFWRPPNFEHLVKTLLAFPGLALGLESQGTGRFLLLVGGGILLGAGLYSDCRSSRETWKIMIPVYLLFFMTVRFCWSVFDQRFFLLILPFLQAYMLRGCFFWGQRSRPIIGSLLMSALAINLFFQDVASAKSWEPNEAGRRPNKTLTFIQMNLPPQAKLLTNKGGLMTLYTKHLNGGTIEVSSPEELTYELQKSGTSYIWVKRQLIADRHIFKQWIRIDHWLHNRPKTFPIIFEASTEKSTVYEVRLPSSFMTAYESYLEARDTLQRGDVVLAQRQLEQALRLYPDFPDALNDTATLLLEKGDLEKAEFRLKTALRLRPDFGLAWLNLARVYKRRHQIDLAFETLQIASKAAVESDDSILEGWIRDEQQQLAMESHS